MAVPSDSHQCPGPGCKASVPYAMLACRAHWYQVSRPIRALVYRTWDHGLGAGSSEHTRAMELAIADMRPIGSA